MPGLKLRRQWTRVRISVRLAALFTALSVTLLLAVGVAVYVQLGRELTNELDRSLVDAAVSVSESVARGEFFLPADEATIGGLEANEYLVQLLTLDGRPAQSSDDLPQRPLLDLEQLATVRRGVTLRETIEGGEYPLRILAVGVPSPAPGRIAVVGVELDGVAEAQAALIAALVPVGLAAALLAGGLGWVVAHRGLAPIARITNKASAINAGALDSRVPVPDREDEVTHLARTLNAMLDRLSTAIQRERTFTADASHELRTPLSILRTQAELTRSRARDERTSAGLDSILEEIDRLGALVDDLLVLARADVDRIDSREHVDLGELAAEVAGRFRVLAESRQVVLTAAGAAVVRGDRRGLDRAVSNLVDNAVRHTPAGGRVQVLVQGDGDGGRVAVTDTGPGVDDVLLPTLFDRFSRGDARSPGGAGLGLAIVSAVATAHGGRASAVNRSDGFEVRLQLP